MDNNKNILVLGIVVVTCILLVSIIHGIEERKGVNASIDKITNISIENISDKNPKMPDKPTRISPKKPKSRGYDMVMEDITVNGTTVGKKIKRVSRDNTTILIKEEPYINSTTNLMTYKKFKVKELEEMLTITNQSDFRAIVTFNRPISTPKLKKLKKKHKLKIGMIRYESTVGGGEMPYDMLEDKKVLNDLESKTAELQKEYKNITNFKLMEGFSAMKAKVPRDEVMNLQNDSKVFLVDLGPKEVHISKYNKTSASWRDLAFYVGKYEE